MSMSWWKFKDFCVVFHAVLRQYDGFLIHTQTETKNNTKRKVYSVTFQIQICDKILNIIKWIIISALEIIYYSSLKNEHHYFIILEGPVIYSFTFRIKNGACIRFNYHYGLKKNLIKVHFIWTTFMVPWVVGILINHRPRSHCTF